MLPSGLQQHILEHVCSTPWVLPSLQEACHVCVAILARAIVVLPLGIAERAATLRRINGFRRSKAHCSAAALAEDPAGAVSTSSLKRVVRAADAAGGG